MPTLPARPPPQDCDPDLSEADIKMVLSADGTPLGEAFVHLHGPRAKLRLALAKDRSACPVRARALGSTRTAAWGLARRAGSGSACACLSWQQPGRLARGMAMAGAV